MEKIYKKLGIVRHEIARVRIAWGCRFWFQIGFVVAWTIATAMFVERFGIQNLWWFFSADAVLVLVGTIFAGFCLPRLQLRQFLLGSILLTIALLAVALAFSPKSVWFFVFLIGAKDLFFAQLNIALYRQTETFFSPNEAQKMLPIIESASIIGTIVGAFVLLQFLGIFETKWTLGIWIFALSMVGFLVYRVPKILCLLPSFASEEKLNPHRKNPLREATHGMGTRSFFRHIAVILCLQAVVFTIIEFEFTKYVQSHILPPETHASAPNLDLQASVFGDFAEKTKSAANFVREEARVAIEQVKTLTPRLIAHKTLAYDLGMFHLLFGLLALVVQLAITSRVLERIGVVRSLISYFAVLLAGIGSLIFGYGGVSALRGIQHGFLSIGESAYHISFYSIFSHRREAVRLFLEGIVKPIGILVGVALIVWIPSEFIFPVAAIFSALAAIAGIPMQKSFTDLSHQNLVDSEQGIASRLHSIEVLGQRGHRDSAVILSQEIQKKSSHPIVREKIIATATKINDPQIVHAYTEILLDPRENDEIKIQVLESIFHLQNLEKYWHGREFSQQRLLNAITKIFEKTNHEHLKKLATMNLFRQLPSPEIVSFFQKTMQKSSDELKSVCLRSCTVFRDPGIVFFLKKYLNHKNPRIRGHAVIALWDFGDRETLQKVIEKLLDGKTDEEKIAGIYAVGETKNREQEQKCVDFSCSDSTEIRLHALIAMAKMRNRHCIRPLREICLGHDEELARRAARMCKRVHPTILEEIRHEIQHEVSRRVEEVLHPHRRQKFSLENLPARTLRRLKWWYRLAQRYDDLVAMDDISISRLNHRNSKFCRASTIRN